MKCHKTWRGEVEARGPDEDANILESWKSELTEDFRKGPPDAAKDLPNWSAMPGRGDCEVGC